MLQAKEDSGAKVPAPAESLLVTQPAVPMHVQVTFTTAPAEFTLKSLGEEVWKEAAPGLEIGKDLEIKFPKEGVDLDFAIAWPEQTRGAARVRLTDPKGRVLEKYLWSEGGPVSDVLTFP